MRRLLPVVHAALPQTEITAEPIEHGLNIPLRFGVFRQQPPLLLPQIKSRLGQFRRQKIFCAGFGHAFLESRAALAHDKSWMIDDFSAIGDGYVALQSALLKTISTLGRACL